MSLNKCFKSLRVAAVLNPRSIDVLVLIFYCADQNAPGS